MGNGIVRLVATFVGGLLMAWVSVAISVGPAPDAPDVHIKTGYVTNLKRYLHRVRPQRHEVTVNDRAPAPDRKMTAVVTVN